MGKYDNLDRNFFTEANRYAELISIGVYHRRLDIQSENLQNLECTYPSLASSSGKLERDGLVEDVHSGVRYGLEIETVGDLAMSRRFLTYDASEYERQAREIRSGREKKKELKTFLERKSGMKAEDIYVPVINLLLYLGQGHYPYNASMKELFRIDSASKEIILEKVPGYSITVMEADYVNPDDFQTDLRAFFKIIQCRKDKRKLWEICQSEEYRDLPLETQKVIAIHLDDKKMIQKIVEEEIEMCQAMRELRRDWKAEGRAEGKEEERIKIIKRLIDLNQEKEFILGLGFTEQEYETALS